jgi:hypothetical protein
MGAALTTASPGETEPVTWRFDGVTPVGGHRLQVLGNPQRVATPLGTSMLFDGDGDRLQIDGNPLADAGRFTLELVAKPLPAASPNLEPRLVHIEDPADSGHRLTLEMRLTDDGYWYADTFLMSDGRGLALIDPTLTHPVGRWTHLAITYDSGRFRSFVDGKPELEGTIDFAPLGVTAKTSVGARMNEVHFFHGLILQLRATPRVLSPEEFLLPPVQ